MGFELPGKQGRERVPGQEDSRRKGTEAERGQGPEGWGQEVGRKAGRRRGQTSSTHTGLLLNPWGPGEDPEWFLSKILGSDLALDLALSELRGSPQQNTFLKINFPFC